MLCGEEGPPGPEVAVPRVGDGGGCRRDAICSSRAGGSGEGAVPCRPLPAG